MKQKTAAAPAVDNFIAQYGLTYPFVLDVEGTIGRILHETQIAIHRCPRSRRCADCLWGGSAIDPQEIGDLERGREIYETGGGVIGKELGVGCKACHSLDGSVKKRPAAPSFQGISERAGERVPGMSTVEYLRQSIVDPSAYVVEGFPDNVMPKGFRFLLSEEDVDAVVAFMLTQ